jgi:hypothetical protein
LCEDPICPGYHNNKECRGHITAESSTGKRTLELIDGYYHTPALLKPLCLATLKINSWFESGRAQKGALDTVLDNQNSGRMCGASIVEKATYIPPSFAKPTTSLGHFMKGHYSGLDNAATATLCIAAGPEGYPGAAYSLDQAINGYREAFSGESGLSLIDSGISYIPNEYARETTKGILDVSRMTGSVNGATGIFLSPSRIGNVNPANLRWSQVTAGGKGRADIYRKALAEDGWKAGERIDVIETADGLVTVDHTRAAVALEQGITEIPARFHLPSDPLPSDMLTRTWNSAGDTATTWGEAVRLRGAGQFPPIGPTGSPIPPKLPRPRRN